MHSMTLEKATWDVQSQPHPHSQTHQPLTCCICCCYNRVLGFWDIPVPFRAGASLQLTWDMEPESNPQGNTWRRLPRGSSSPLTAEGRWLHLCARWLRVKIHPEGECDGSQGSQSLVRKGSTCSPTQRQQKVPILQDQFLWQHKILTPNAVTPHHVVKTQQCETKIFRKGECQGLSGSAQPWHITLGTWVNLSRLSVPPAGRSPPLPKHLSWSTLVVDLCLQPLTPASPAVPDTWDLVSCQISASGKGNIIFKRSEPRWGPPTCLSFIVLVKHTTQHR